jgi:hypothetical protein
MSTKPGALFLCGIDSQKATNLARHERISPTIDHDTADGMAITGLSMAARAHAVTDRAEAEKVLTMLPLKYPDATPLPMKIPTPDRASSASAHSESVGIWFVVAGGTLTLTFCVRGVELLPALFESPLYTAVIECVPCASADVVNAAVVPDSATGARGSHCCR